MAANSLVTARIDASIKEEATIVLESVGLTVSDAIRLLLPKVAKEHFLPFNIEIPNKNTAKAIKEARNKKTSSFNNITELLDDLNEKN
jgi:DNA-damage-inducible protein J